MKLKPTIPVDDIGIKIDDLKGVIEFKNVSFSYPNRPGMVLTSQL